MPPREEKQLEGPNGGSTKTLLPSRQSSSSLDSSDACDLLGQTSALLGDASSDKQPQHQQQQLQHVRNEECSHATMTHKQESTITCFLRLTQRLYPVTTTLPLLVGIDMFAVSLVVPLLFQYYRAAGIHSAGPREILASLFSISQIVGGLVLGVVTDADWVHHRTVLLLSFAGSSLSYGLLTLVLAHARAGGGGDHSGTSNRYSLYLLMASRLLVGLVKQTMTVSIAVVTANTTEQTRARHMGRLRAASTVAWIVGPSVGAVLFKYQSHAAPAIAACGLFALNFVLAIVLVNANDLKTGSEKKLKEEKKSGNMWSNLKSCFSSRLLASVVVVKLIVHWVTKATSYSQLASFYEDLYGLEPHHRGYISSYQQFLQFIVQSTLVDHIMKIIGGERRTTCIFTVVAAMAMAMETRQSLPLFLLMISPILSVSFAMTDLSIQTLLTTVAPSNAVFSVFAALDVLQNAVSVSVPFYRAILFRWLTPDSAETAIREGDPDPIQWIWTSSLHWCIAAGCVSFLLLTNESAWRRKLKHDYDSKDKHA
jgi:Major Facilitator Superfamily